MKIFGIILILIHASLFCFGQNTLPYPDLIPIVIGEKYGYSDKNLHIKIPAKYSKAELFEEDFNFQIWHVNNPDIVKYGTSDYAWVEIKEQRYRINKKGIIVYTYNSNDFKKGETIVSISRNSEDYSIDSVDTKTLYQYVKEKKTGKYIFPVDTLLEDFKTKNPQPVKDGIRFIFYPIVPDIPYTDYTDPKSILQGIKNTKTNRILIPPKYRSLDLLFNQKLRIRQYPLMIAYSYSWKDKVYIGLNGKEFIIE